MIATQEQVRHATENGLGIFPMPAPDYFADFTAVSQSMLKTFLDRRRLYEAYYLLGVPEPEPTDPMRKGTATHTALLEPERFESLVVTYPKGILSKNGAVSTTEAKAFRDEHEAAGRVVLKDEQYAAVKAMADSVRRVCGKWLDLPGRKEQCIYWQDELTGMRCKGRTDWLLDRSHTLDFDLKTTTDASPNAFRRRCEDGGYWLQAAHYSEGLAVVTGKPVEFYFVAVETAHPFACAIYSLDQPALVAAKLARRRVLNDLASCLATRDFSEPWESQVTRLPLRSWCFDPSQLQSS